MRPTQQTTTGKLGLLDIDFTKAYPVLRCRALPELGMIKKPRHVSCLLLAETALPVFPSWRCQPSPFALLEVERELWGAL